jgi:menaquinol-cytochrome c reductase iron-sulfur subunit
MKKGMDCEAGQTDLQTRRDFSSAAIYSLWGLISAGLAAPAAPYLLAPAKPAAAGGWDDVGEIARLPANEPVEVVFYRNRSDGWKVISEKTSAWILKEAGDRVTAFGPQCTHLGCAHHFDESRGQFVCPCHNSLFSLKGEVLAGPAPRPLDQYETKVENGRLLLGSLRPKTEGSV